MAHNYVGADDPASIVPAIPIAGHGVFPIAEVTDDQDDRDAGSAMAGIEANADKINWLVWRMINIVDGAITNYGTSIGISNPWTTLGRFVRSGVAAWMADRAPIHISGANATFTFTDGDTFVLDTFTHGATRTYSFAPPASNAPPIYRFRLRSAAIAKGVDGPGGTGDDSFANSGTILFKLSTGNRAFLQYTGGALNRENPWCLDCEYDSSIGAIYVVGPLPTAYGSGLLFPLYAP
jgi:hypothetical protein